MFEEMVEVHLCTRRIATMVNPNPKPIRPKQPLVGISPFVSCTVFANLFMRYVQCWYALQELVRATAVSFNSAPDGSGGGER